MSTVNRVFVAFVYLFSENTGLIHEFWSIIESTLEFRSKVVVWAHSQFFCFGEIFF